MTRNQPERRRHRRYPVKLGVDLRVADSPQRRGALRELSLDGALLNRQGLPPGLAPGRALRLGLRLRTRTQDQAFRVEAEVIHGDERCIGVRFVQPGAAFTRALDGYLQFLEKARAETAAKQRELEQRRAPLRNRLRATAITEAGLAQLADGLIEHWIKSLRTLADQAANDEERTRWADDACVLDHALRHDGLGFTLTALWLRPLQPGQTTACAANTPALLDDSDADGFLARQSLVDTLEHRFFSPLEAYRTQVHLLTESGRPLPFTPPCLVDALEQLLESLALSDDSRHRLLRLSDQPLNELIDQLLPALTANLYDN